ncbi:MAG TPA: MFS transporter [Candidatus Pristimantibacillus sp.]|jgi:EmrB/QacA subfamily drug resistance transporter|nr:MFS transporter [Candidatus Pristimantibacillus sp.]
MSKLERLVLVISILASFVAFLDGSVVNVALPAISRELGGGLGTQQWVVDAYLITLGSLILVAGSLSDLFGRRKILKAGLVGFGAASILCAIAPSGGFLIAARALQGVAGALLVPSSLALIMSTFSGPAQGKAIGSWTAWTGISFIIGPLLGGFLVDTLSWRLIFAINVLPIAFCLWLLLRLPHTEHTERAKIDTLGALLCSFGLFGSVFALIEQPHRGWQSLATLIPLLGGLLLLGLFVWYESRNKAAMLPLSLFKVRNFSAGNLATTAIYGALSIATFIIVIFLQQVGGYRALTAGLALVPVTAVMFFLSPRFGALSGKYGPRFFMAAGPMVAGAGFLLMLRVTENVHYWTQLFPGVLAFALGLSMTVAPLTAAVLGDIDTKHAGVASATNNAVARIAGLVAIAAIGVVIGDKLNLAGFHRALLFTAVLIILGGVISAVGIRNPHTKPS